MLTVQFKYHDKKNGKGSSNIKALKSLVSMLQFGGHKNCLKNSIFSNRFTSYLYAI